MNANDLEKIAQDLAKKTGTPVEECRAVMRLIMVQLGAALGVRGVEEYASAHGIAVKKVEA